MSDKLLDSIRLHIKDVAAAFNLDYELFRSFFEKELRYNNSLAQLGVWRNSGFDWRNVTPLGGAGTLLNACMLYSIVRYFNMTCVTETGVSGGFYTAFLLDALSQNGWEGGALTSIEISADINEVGKLIPPQIKEKAVGWDLRLGTDALAYFDDLKKRNIPLKGQLYCHDSVHNMRHMSKELSYFKGCTSDRFFLFFDDQDAEMFWARSLKNNSFNKPGYSVKWISGNECTEKGHLGGFILYDKIK